MRRQRPLQKGNSGQFAWSPSISRWQIGQRTPFIDPSQRGMCPRVAQAGLYFSARSVFAGFAVLAVSALAAGFDSAGFASVAGLAASASFFSPALYDSLR